jgi:hypothetical protein
MYAAGKSDIGVVPLIASNKTGRETGGGVAGGKADDQGKP